MSERPELPPSDSVSASTLARMFSDVTNSYKFLFLLAILDKLEQTAFAASSLNLDELVLEMLATAWYPHSYFRLSFGKQDKITTQLEDVTVQFGLREKIKAADRQALKELLGQRVSSKNDLKRYVPYRLIRPFFANETRGLNDTHVNPRVAELSAEYFVSRKPTYKISNDGTQITVHPDWVNYFKQNNSVVRGWIAWNWLQYMQRCNPNVPNLSMKLFPPLERDSLSSQTSYWKNVLKHMEVRCIYSGDAVVLKDMSLDHFVPWSFVAHDQLWNLIPTSKGVNSQKSDNLPSEQYLPALANLQYTALHLSRQTNPKWKEYAFPFLNDLGFRDEDALEDRALFEEKYKSTFRPLLMLAEARGFAAGWEFR